MFKLLSKASALVLFVVLLLILSACNGGKQNTRHYAWQQIVTYNIILEDVELEGKSEEKHYSRLIENIFSDIKSAKQKAYSFVENRPLTIEEFKEIGHKVDTVWIENPEPPYDIEMKIVEHFLDMDDIKSLKFIEEWNWDKVNSRMDKRLLAIAPRMASYDHWSGDLRGYIPLFWVYFDENAIELNNPEF